VKNVKLRVINTTVISVRFCVDGVTNVWFDYPIAKFNLLSAMSHVRVIN